MILKEKVTSGGHGQFWIILGAVEEEGKTLGCFSASWLRSSVVCVSNMCLSLMVGRQKTLPELRQTSVQR